MTKQTSGHVFVKTASGLVIPFKPPALDYASAHDRESERKPEYLLTTPGQAYAGHVVTGKDGEPELWLEPFDWYSDVSPREVTRADNGYSVKLDSDSE